MTSRPYAIIPSFLAPQMGRSLEEFFSPVNASLSNFRDSIFSPRTDVREIDGEYVIAVDMPGVEIRDIDVEVNDGILTIQGRRGSQIKQDQPGVQRLERLMGTFQRRFALPDNVDFEAVSAACNAGVLEVHIPKLPARAPRKVTVQSQTFAGTQEEGPAASPEPHRSDADTVSQEA